MILIAALIWLYDVLRCGLRFVRTDIDLFVLVYLGIGLLSLTQAAYPIIGLFKWAYYTSTGILICYLLIHYLTDWSAIWRLVRALCIICGTTALYTLLCHFLGRDYLWGDLQRQFNPYYDGNWRATGPFGNAVFTGAYFSLCIFFIIWLFSQTKGPGKRLFYGMLILILFATIAFGQSRGAWLASGVGSFVMFAIFFRQVWRRSRYDQRCAMVVSIIAASFIFVGVFQAMGMSRLLEKQMIDIAYRTELTSFSKLQHSERFRIAQYKNTFGVLKKHPFLGVGFGNFTRVYDSYKDPATSREFPARTTENMYLMFAAETGLLGFFAAVSLLGAIFYTVFRSYLQARPGPVRSLMLTFLAGGGGFLVNMGTWDALSEPTLRMTFWILVGILLAVVRLAKEEPDTVGPIEGDHVNYLMRQF